MNDGVTVAESVTVSIAAASGALSVNVNDAITVAESVTVSDPPLTTDLISFWKLEESSGTRVDVVKAYDMSDNNTVTQAAGKIGNSAQFTRANSEWLERADNSDLSTGANSFSVTAWVYLDTKTNTMAIASKTDGVTAGDSEYLLWYDTAADRFKFSTYDDLGTETVATASTFGAPATATWYLVIGTRTQGSLTIGISVNAGTQDTAVETLAPPDTTAAIRLGANDATEINFWDGRIDAVGFWKKALSADERTSLYNAGAGREYPFV